MLNRIVKTHWTDYKGEADKSTADPSCGECFGTGSIGRLLSQGRIRFNKPVEIICRCVTRPGASVDAVKILAKS